MNFLIDHLIYELETHFQYQLDAGVKDLVRQSLLEYDQTVIRKLEEKDSIIKELKQNLLELTEKRFRKSLSNNGLNNSDEAAAPVVDFKSIEFLLNEKESQISAYANELRQRENEVTNLKQTIKEQDEIILSHNSNIYVRKKFNFKEKKNKILLLM